MHRTLIMVKVALVLNHSGLMGVRGVNRTLRADIDQNPVTFSGVQQVRARCCQISSDPFSVQPVVVGHPFVFILQNTRITRKDFVRAARRTVCNDWVSRITIPALQILRRGNPSLLVPSSFSLVLGVVKQIVYIFVFSLMIQVIAALYFRVSEEASRFRMHPSFFQLIRSEVDASPV